VAGLREPVPWAEGASGWAEGAGGWAEGAGAEGARALGRGGSSR
jgi:hypothetical protein